MTIQEFDGLKAGDKIDGRDAHGDGVVEQIGEVLVVRWADGSVTWALNILRSLWGNYAASPMRYWFVLNATPAH